MLYILLVFMNQKIIIIDLPKSHGSITWCWYDGYVVHEGHKSNSLNHATLYSKEHNILPDQNRLRNDFDNFKKVLETAGFDVIVLPFPDPLNQIDSLHHDAVFIRDSWFMFNDYRIKGHYSVSVRQKEADVYAPIMAEKFNKKIIELPQGAYLEFWETTYLQTQDGSFYFGGLSRSNKIGHDFVKNIVKPDHYILLESTWYHLDTVFSPVIDKNNKIIALLVTKWMFTPSSIKLLESLHIEIIFLDNIDSSWAGSELWNYSVNALLAPGILVSCAQFTTAGVEKKLADLGIHHYIVPLTDYKYAWWSVHCLTNEIYE